MPTGFVLLKTKVAALEIYPHNELDAPQSLLPVRTISPGAVLRKQVDL